METRRDVFQAIADPTRREIIDLISVAPLTINGIAEKFSVSRPAISQHVKILVECGLVFVRQEGRERYCEPQLEKLDEVSSWVEKYRRFWTSKLDALESYLDSNIHNLKAKKHEKKSQPRKGHKRK